MKKLFLFSLVVLLIFCFAPIGLSQQTGSIRGTVTDDQKNPLPGVTVTASSPQMQGKQSYLSTREGDFRFSSLPPGTYTITTELSGFQMKESPSIRVNVGATTIINVAMSPATLKEQVTVSALAPILDIQASNIAVTVDKSFIQNVPMKRDILDIYQTTPGGVPRAESLDYQKSVSVAGGAFHESKISIDGVDLLDASRAYMSADVSFDAIEEVELVIGGQKAEVGQVSAGFVNVVTKSGGNTISGSMTGGGYTDSFAQIVVPKEELDAFKVGRVQLKKYKFDIGFGLGGPIIKDKVWFFMAPRYGENSQITSFIPFTDPQDGIYHPGFDLGHNEEVALGKITVQFAKNIKWFGMYQYNRSWDSGGSVTNTSSPKESSSPSASDAHTISSVLTYILDQNTFLEARLGRVKTVYGGSTGYRWEGPVNRASHNDRATGYSWGRSSGLGGGDARDNLNLGLFITRFQDNFLGSDHEIKVGLEYATGFNSRHVKRRNPYTYNWNRGTPWYYSDTTPYQGRFQVFSGPLDDQDRGYDAGYYRISGFFQDSFQIGKRLTVNLGLRYDDSHAYVPAAHIGGWNDVWENGLANIILPSIFLPAGATLDAPRMDDVMVFKFLSPRIGLAYDIFGTGKTVLKASFVRYGEAMYTSALESMIPLLDRTITFTWWDDNRDGLLSLPPIDRYQPAVYSNYDTDVAPLRKQIATNLRVPYNDEWILGITQMIGRDFSLSLNYMGKSGAQMLATKDLNIQKGSEWWIPYTVTDPGWDMTLGTKDDKPLTVFMLRSDAPVSFPQKDNVDDGWRKYWGITLIANKRMSNGWMANASLVISRARSNIRWGYLTFAGWENWWDPNVDIYRTGYSENDTPIIFKAMSSVEMPLGFILSGYFRYLSGEHFERHVTVEFPTTLQGYRPRNTTVSVNAEPEGSRSFAPVTNMDMRLEKAFNLKGFRLGVWVDLFNVFGNWSLFWSQYRGSDGYSTMATRIQGGYINANGTVARFANYGIPDAIYGVRQLSLGVRIIF